MPKFDDLKAKIALFCPENIRNKLIFMLQLSIAQQFKWLDLGIHAQLKSYHISKILIWAFQLQKVLQITFIVILECPNFLYIYSNFLQIKKYCDNNFKLAFPSSKFD